MTVCLYILEGDFPTFAVIFFQIDFTTESFFAYFREIFSRSIKIILFNVSKICLSAAPLGLTNDLSFSAEGDLTTDGDIIIGGLFPVYDDGGHGQECGSFNSNPGYQYMEAMLYALDTINADPGILPGIKLGSVIADTCNSERLSSVKTKKFIKIIYVPESTNYSELVSVVGPMLDGNAKNVASILRVFDIPEISYGTMSSELINKGEYEYFFRTVPSDEFFYTAMAEFLKSMDWKYVAVVTSDRVVLGEDNIYSVMIEKGICVRLTVEIDRSIEDEWLDEFIENLICNDGEPKIVILLTSTRESRAMLAAKKRNPRGNELQFIAGLTWSNRRSIVQGRME